MNLLNDSHLIDLPEPTRFECAFCHEDSPISEHNIVNRKDCCDCCLEDMQFEKCGKCIGGLCECSDD